MRISRLVIVTTAALLIVTPLAAKPAKKGGAAAAPCSLAHYPVAVGNSSEYRITTKQLDAEGKVVSENSSTYREEIKAVEAGGFTMTSVNDGNANDSKWTCSSDGIALVYDEYPDTKITSSGVSVPATMEVGGSWTSSFTMKGPGVSQTTKTTNRVVSREAVAVPAGGFEGWRIDWKSETTAADQKPTIIEGTQWYVTGVGMVKSLLVVPMESEEVRSVENLTELMKYSSK